MAVVAEMASAVAPEVATEATDVAVVRIAFDPKPIPFVLDMAHSRLQLVLMSVKISFARFHELNHHFLCVLILPLRIFRPLLLPFSFCGVDI